MSAERIYFAAQSFPEPDSEKEVRPGDRSLWRYHGDLLKNRKK